MCAGSFHAKSATPQKRLSKNLMKLGILIVANEKLTCAKFKLSVTSG
jgi:hypothetical protein